MSRRPTRQPRSLLILLCLVTPGLAACGDDGGPVVDPLAGLDELAIYAATVDRLGLLTPSREPHDNLRQAAGWPGGPFGPDLFGETLVYQPPAGWTVAEDRQPVGGDVLRVIWYPFSNGVVTDPSTERGHVDLTRLDAAAGEVDIRIINAASATLADYTLGNTRSESVAARVEAFHLAGVFGDGARQLQLALYERRTEGVATGDAETAYSLQFSEAGFSYSMSIAAYSAEASGAQSAMLVASVTLDGVTSRIELDMEESGGAPLTGAGFVLHGGVRIANVAVAGSDLQMTFIRPDGQGFTLAQQTRLGTLVDVLITPGARTVRDYFS
jgi:hypothetical protein